MDQSTIAIITSCISGVVAISVSVFTSRSQIMQLKRKFMLDQKKEKETELQKIRIQYLNPLIISTEDLLEKFKLLQKEITEELSGRAAKKDEKTWVEKFNYIKEEAEHCNNHSDFAKWCNGEGTGAVTTLYNNMVYFARAAKIRTELPFIKLDAESDTKLLSHLYNVRGSFGGKLNIWIELQDSLGEYITKSDGSVYNYKEFCSLIMDSWEHIWFLRVLDFYRDFHLKLEVDVPKIIAALEKLLEFTLSKYKSN